MFPMPELHPITPLGDGDLKYREMLIAVAVCSEQELGATVPPAGECCLLLVKLIMNLCKIY